MSENIAKKEVKPVVKNKATTVKKSPINTYIDDFLKNDLKQIAKYTVDDVIKPTVKSAIEDVIITSIHTLLYHDSTTKPRSGLYSNHVSYSGMYNKRPKYRNVTNGRYSTSDSPEDVMKQRNDMYNFSNIILETRDDAEVVLNGMKELIDMYHVATIADMYDLANITGFDYTYNNYGWIDISTATISRVRAGYMILMPPAKPLK